MTNGIKSEHPQSKYSEYVNLDPNIYTILKSHSHINPVFIHYQRGPVGVQVADLQRGHKLGAGHHQEVQVQEELELLVENLRGAETVTPFALTGDSDSGR